MTKPFVLVHRKPFMHSPEYLEIRCDDMDLDHLSFVRSDEAQDTCDLFNAIAEHYFAKGREYERKKAEQQREEKEN